jgi:hypothetical protein
MRWFRTNRTFGGHLALFALALQLVLSFGHIHREDIYGYGPPRVAATVPATLPASDPAHQPAHHTDDYCAICATLSLLGASLAAEAPQVALRFETQAIEHFDRIAAISVAPRRSGFQSRAPPTA